MQIRVLWKFRFPPGTPDYGISLVVASYLYNLNHKTMDANSILLRHWEDVVFEYRNKAYGAYLLRKAYSQRLLVGVVVTLTVVALILLLQRIYSSDQPATNVIPSTSDPGTILSQPPSIVRPLPPQGVIHHNEANTQNRRIVVTSDPVDQPEIDAIRSFVSNGDEQGEIGTVDGEGVIPAVVDLPPAVLEPAIVDFAQIMPSYEGGMEAMMKFIQKKIHYPRAPRQMGIDGTVYVRFVVNGDGSVSDVQILRGFHPDCDKEALRVVSMLPAWKGGSNNGRPVAVRMVLPIKFSLK
jgi:protein TonB